MNTIWFDMDGTIADLYGVDGWLYCLRAELTRPYIEARPLVSMSVLARYLNRLQRAGYMIGIISWTARDGSREYDNEVARAKRDWLARHLPSVDWDFVDILPYGEPKHQGRRGILFDDEEANREAWGAGAYDETKIFEILKAL